jgi:hypothetical protein
VKFQLPETLPGAVSDLDALLDQARASINVIQARYKAGEKLTPEDVDEANELLAAVDKLSAARAEAASREQATDPENVAALMDRADAALNPTAPEADTSPEQPDGDSDDDSDSDGDGGDQPAEQPSEQPQQELEPAAAAASTTPVSFAGVGHDDPPPAVRQEPGWEMDPSCPGFRNGMGRVGFLQLAKHIDTVRPGSRARNRPNKATSTTFSAQVLARLQRDMPVIEDSHALVAAIESATDESKLPGGSLTAAGGWCAPSEQIYDFCDVPNASDLLSMPDVVINRGGIRWPNEPDLTLLFEEGFEWFFTEPELEAVDSGDGTPTAVKQCVDIPCPDSFEEIRLAAVGYCVEAGILQTQGWPELIAWFMASLAQEHLRALSRRSILDIANGSEAISIPADTQIGVVSAILNSMALRAATLRLQRGLPRNATIEAIIPAWCYEVMRADLAMQEGLPNKAVSDAQLAQLFSVRNIAPQYVGDWQSRTAGLPGHVDTVRWPDTVQVLMYPAGTWFRSLSPVIELGVMYPKEQLQVNRYTRFFTEDAIAVGKRCNRSELVTIPICVSGAISDRQAVDCSATGS